MGNPMDLIAGDERDIVLALAIDDIAAFDDADRFTAHLSLGDELDPAWLDLFSESVRLTTGRVEPADFAAARTEVPATATERVVERVGPAWVQAVARVPDERVDAVADQWRQLLDVGHGVALAEDRLPWVRDLARRLVAFCRAAEAAPVVIFAWGF